MPPQVQAPPSTFTMKEFADNIRAKYPESKIYKEKSDYDLSKAFIDSKTEYGVYKDKITDWPTEFPIVPKNQGTSKEESFLDTIKRAAAAGKNVTQKQIDENTKKGFKEAPAVLAAAPVIGFGGAAAMAGAGRVAQKVFVDEIVPKVVKGRVQNTVQKALIKQINEHLSKPGTILKTPYGRAIEYYLLTKLGVSKSDITKLMSMIE